MFACICWLHVGIIHFISFIHICKCASYRKTYIEHNTLRYVRTSQSCFARELNDRTYHKCQATVHNVEKIAKRTKQPTESVCVAV